MATSARRLVAPQPPADLNSIALTPATRPVVTWYRITDRAHTTCLHWSRDGVYRFDSPTAKFGVCYAAQTITSAIQEIWGDRARHKAPIDWTEFAEKDVWRIDLPPVSLYELTGPNLTTIRATLQCFTGSYPTSQAWGAALMQHPANLDGLLYLGRRCGATCLALFGDSATGRPYQAAMAETRLGPLVGWNGFFPLRTQLRIRISNLPATRPPLAFTA